MEPTPNRIADYMDAKTEKLLFSIPFYHPDPNYAGGRPYKPGDDYLAEELPKPPQPQPTAR